MKKKSTFSTRQHTKTTAEKRLCKTQTQKTTTCMHCRYEYPADAPQCTICGYPWHWLNKDASLPE